MEESINLDLGSVIEREFSLKPVAPESYSPLNLAYIGDCVFDLVIKSIHLNEGNMPVHTLHEKTSHLVNAKTQSEIMRHLQELLTKEEHDIFKRGRNTKSVSAAKNQSITDYRRATGFEALIGYLYLKKEYERLIELIKIGLLSLEEED